MRHFKLPVTITYVTLESWKMMIILIVRKGVSIWTKWLVAKILGQSALLRLARRQKQNSLKRSWNMAGPFTAWKNSRQIFIIKYAPPFEKDIAIWKRNCANTESAAARKSEEDHCRVFSIKKEKEVWPVGSNNLLICGRASHPLIIVILQARPHRYEDPLVPCLLYKPHHRIGIEGDILSRIIDNMSLPFGG